MDLHIVSRHLPLTDPLRHWVADRVRHALDQFQGRVRSVRVSLDDLNGPKGGDDRRCAMAVRLEHAAALRVESRGSDLYATVSLAAERLSRRVGAELDRLRRPRRGARLGLAPLAVPPRRSRGRSR